MKRVIALVLAALPALAEADAVTSASVADFYADGMLVGDDLMNAINAYSGFYAVASVNPDGTPHAGARTLTARSPGTAARWRAGFPPRSPTRARR